MWSFPLLHTSLTSRASRRCRRRVAPHGLADFALPTRNNCPAACASASALPGRSRYGPRSCYGRALVGAGFADRELLMEDFIRLLADGTMGAAYVTHNLEEAVASPTTSCAVARPGRVREVVTIPMTRSERGDINAAASSWRYRMNCGR